MNSHKNQNYSLKKLSDCIKILVADTVEKAKSGHPGMPLGFSDVMTCLAFKFLKFNPADPKWFNRDRLVLSAGHGSTLLYSFFYLAGYKNFTLDDIKNFRQLGAKTAGHPEYELFEGIETTTGPLGQGLANSVGMALAEKKYADKVGKDVCDHKIYAIVGDGCLMEGVAYEATSLAGHLCLNNLIVLFDDNGISIDGKTDLTVTENHLQKFDAMGFNTIAVDGHDYDQICTALEAAQNSDKPSFIAFKTLIGKGAKNKENSEKSHGAPLGLEEIEYLKNNAEFGVDAFYIPAELKEQWRKAWERNVVNYEKWQKAFNELDTDEKNYLKKSKINLPEGISVPDVPEATRVSSGKIVEALMRAENKIICGSADLAGSNGLKNAENKRITADDFSGNFLYYGVREHAMAAIMNGLALSGFVPIGGTFFVFSDYMRPAVRLSALMSLPVIYVMTHDSIGLGEDGPTHQPVEHLASFRAMPNINVFRPADFEEVKECYQIAMKSTQTPSMIVLSRQNVPQISKRRGDENLVTNGGYVMSEASNIENIDVTIFATGSEVGLAMETQKALEAQDKSVRVCSVPCFELLMEQGDDYLSKLKGGANLLVAIEAATSFGWHSIIGNDGLFFGMDSFGASAPAKELYQYFGLSVDKISDAIIERF